VSNTIAVEEQRRIEAELRAVIGQRAWGTTLGERSTVTVELGEISGPEGRPRGRWHLVLQSCAWRIEREGRLIAGSGDDRDLLANRVALLNGRALTGFELVDRVDARLRFEGDVVVRLFAQVSEDSEHWLLALPGGETLCTGPEASVGFRESDDL